MGNPDLGATFSDFMLIFQSIDYSKFAKFPNVADEISTKLLLSFHVSKKQVVVPDRYDSEIFQIKLLKDNTG